MTNETTDPNKNTIGMLREVKTSKGINQTRKGKILQKGHMEHRIWPSACEFV